MLLLLPLLLLLLLLLLTIILLLHLAVTWGTHAQLIGGVVAILS
jgi:hypothetical protein